jgi:tRNA A-37 threonylcarbamoyl transferase component Bud32
VDGITTLVLSGTIVAAAVIAIVIIRVASDRARRKAEAAADEKLSKMTKGKPSPRAVASLVTAGRFQEALDLLVAQGDFKGAGRVALRMQHPLRAAELFERAEDFEAAATAFLRIPDFRRAAQCHGRAGHHEKAAEVYTQIGDLWAAAEELVAAGRPLQAAAVHRQLGNDLQASKLEATALRAAGKTTEAASAFSAAGELASAAECLQEAGRLREAAATWQLAGKPDHAAALLEKVGAESEAAALYEEAGDHTAAARLYQRVQNPHKEIDALVAAGEILAAGHLAYKLGDKARAEEILLLSTPADRGYARACLLLGRILDEKNRHPDALRYYGLFVERGIPTDRNRDAFRVLSQIFEKELDFDHAYRALQKLDAAGLLPPEDREAMERAKRRVGSAPIAQGAAAAASVTTGIMRDPREAVPDVLADRYQVLRRLGEGGTAIVYLAHDKKLKRDVVLKFLSNPSLPGDLAVDYFLREAQIIAGMSHPNIVQVFDVGDAGGRLYMILEFLEGDTLEADLMKQSGRGLAPRDVARMAAELASALEYAHERKVIHRDLKPGNIMILPDRHTKLMDFGMAKALEVHRDRSLYICGTPDYMSPEQETGLDLTAATDIYSFGLVLLESLLGAIPSGPTAQAARFARLDSLERSSLPQAVKKVIEQSLAIDPEARPATAGEVARRLAEGLGIPH